jgi:predicted dehydrogenase
VGVIGCGGWSRVHLAALAASPHVACISLAGRNETALAQRAGEFPRISRTTTDYRRLLDDATVDAVTVVLPHDLHAEAGTAALEAGKHLICEKPAGRTIAEFDRLVQSAERNSRKLFVVMNQLYNPLPLRVRKLLESGAIGRPFLSVENSFANHAEYYRMPTAWRTSIDRAGGGVLIDGGYHMVYRHLYQLESWGPPAWVVADAAQLGIDPRGVVIADKGEDYVAITVGFDRPLRIQWNHGWSLAAEPTRRRQCFVAGTDGTLEFTDQRESPLILHHPTESEAVSFEPGPWTGSETTHACLLDFLECLVSQRDPENATVSRARQTLATICGAYASANRSSNRFPLSRH